MSGTEIDATVPSNSAGIADITVTNPQGTSSTAPADRYLYAAPSRDQPLAPSRICDTRSYAGNPGEAGCIGKTLTPGGVLTVPVAGYGGIPAKGATAAVLNLTVTDTTTAGYLTVYPQGGTQPLASSLNWHRGQTVANLVTAPLGPAGTIEVQSPFGDADVVIDVEGYDAALSGTAGLYDALSPFRICDTRTSQATNPCTGEAPASGTSLSVQVAGKAGVPASVVEAAVLNVTAIDAATSGFLTVYPAGNTRPEASNVNYGPGQIVANRVVVQVGTGGQVTIFSNNGAPQIAVDVTGYYTASTNGSATGAQFSPTGSPARICDTRSSQPSNPCTAKTLAAGGTLVVAVGGEEGVPADATAVVVNVTAVGSTTGGYLTVFPTGMSRPVVSDLNFGPGDTVANMVVATLGPGGSFGVYNARGSTNVVIDLVGWYA